MMKKGRTNYGRLISEVVKAVGPCNGWYPIEDDGILVTRGWHDDVYQARYRSNDPGKAYYMAVEFNVRYWDQFTVEHLADRIAAVIGRDTIKEKAPNTSEVLEALPPEWGEVCM